MNATSVLLSVEHFRAIEPVARTQTQDGHPGHPLYLSASLQPFMFITRDIP